MNETAPPSCILTFSTASAVPEAESCVKNERPITSESDVPCLAAIAAAEPDEFPQPKEIPPPYSPAFPGLPSRCIPDVDLPELVGT